MIYDYLIIGQGLAGSLFAYHLNQRNHSFQVVDGGRHGASHVCGGMYNPVVLRRYAEVWQAKDQISYAKTVFGSLSETLGVKLDYPQPIYRLFNNQNDCIAWQKKSQTFPEYLSHQVLNHCSPKVASLWGIGEVKMSGRIEVKQMLAAIRSKLIDNQQLITAEMDYAQLEIQEGIFIYRGNQYKKVVCCEGFGIKQNPFFRELPLNGNKGETLYIKVQGLNLNGIIKQGVFLCPTNKKDTYLVGSTYDWNTKNSIPTQKAKEELIEKLRRFFIADFTIVSQQAGMRPTVFDRRPLLGEHAEIKNLYILNGLGTRGVMLGPMMSRYLYDFIEYKKPLPEAVDICRVIR